MSRRSAAPPVREMECHLFEKCVRCCHVSSAKGWLLCRTEKRERQREAKAEVAAQLEKSIEKELLERLQKGVYPTDIVNINMKEYEKVI